MNTLENDSFEILCLNLELKARIRFEKTKAISNIIHAVLKKLSDDGNSRLSRNEAENQKKEMINFIERGKVERQRTIETLGTLVDVGKDRYDIALSFLNTSLYGIGYEAYIIKEKYYLILGANDSNGIIYFINKDQKFMISEIEFDVLEEEEVIDEYETKTKLKILRNYIENINDGMKYEKVIDLIDNIVLHVSFPSFEGVKKEINGESVYKEIMNVIRSL